MTWHPQKSRPRNRDFRDASPPILDWVSGKYTQPHTDARRLETIAEAIKRQFKVKTRKGGKRNA
jgi:hypothetical protein